MMKAMITDIQKFSIHDGDGIRTTVFFKGCPLSCVWCHNPETQRLHPELLYNREKCVCCLACIPACPTGSIIQDAHALNTLGSCTACGACTEACLTGAREIAGKDYTVHQLMHEIDKDAMFYEQSGGGVTLSGGEVMTADMGFVEELLHLCKSRGYQVNIDTCGYAPFEHFIRILNLVDVFLYDIKVMNPDKHRQYTGCDNKLILDNLIGLSAAGGKIAVRLPLIEGVNSSDDDMNEVLNFLKPLNITRVHLLPYHDTGRHKAERMGIVEHPGLKAPTAERLDEIRQKFHRSGFDARIGG
jgi:pyruvate formate lyase activating enzyme